MLFLCCCFVLLNCISNKSKSQFGVKKKVRKPLIKCKFCSFGEIYNLAKFGHYPGAWSQNTLNIIVASNIKNEVERFFFNYSKSIEKLRNNSLDIH